MNAQPMKTAMVLAGLYLLVSCSGEPEQPQTMAEASPELTATVDEALSLIGAADEVRQSFYDKSIAVLPFTDLSENSDQEYFSDGLSQDLINRLAMMPDLQVAGNESSFYYKDRDEVLSNIGDALQVENILLGSVRKSGDNLRVTAQLVNADDGFNIWSRTYDRELADVFSIQNEIVDEVVSALSVTLGAGEFAIPGMTRNIEAYDKTLQAQALYNQFTPDNVFRAINLLEEAVRLDPEYGRGWLILGDIYDQSQIILSQYQAVDFPAQAANAFANAARIAPEMPELMLVEAGSLRNQGRFLESENIYQRYFESYGYSVARAMDEYAQMLGRTGQFNEALAMLRRATRTEPFAPRFTYRLALLELYRGNDLMVSQLADYGQNLEGGDYLFSALEWELALRDGDLARAAELIDRYFQDSAAPSYDTTVSRHFMEKFAAVLKVNDFETSTDDIIGMINDPSITPLELQYVARLVAVMGQPEIALDYWFEQMANPAIWDNIYADMRRLPDFNQLLQEKGLVDYWRATGNWGEYCVAAAGQDFVCK
jgi:TolB-like protein